MHHYYVMKVENRESEEFKTKAVFSGDCCS